VQFPILGARVGYRLSFKSVALGSSMSGPSGSGLQYVWAPVCLGRLAGRRLSDGLHRWPAKVHRRPTGGLGRQLFVRLHRWIVMMGREHP
jgi:hypothetical protein